VVQQQGKEDKMFTDKNLNSKTDHTAYSVTQEKVHSLEVEVSQLKSNIV
jgi:hypothetical protein